MVTGTARLVLPWCEISSVVACSHKSLSQDSTSSVVRETLFTKLMAHVHVHVSHPTCKHKQKNSHFPDFNIFHWIVGRQCDLSCIWAQDPTCWTVDIAINRTQLIQSVSNSRVYSSLYPSSNGMRAVKINYDSRKLRSCVSNQYIRSFSNRSARCST